MDLDRVNPLHVEIAKLRERIDVLEAELKSREDEVTNRVGRIAARFKTSPTESRIIALLAQGGTFSKHQIMDGCKLFGESDGTVNVHIMRIRRKIAPLVIKSQWGFGYGFDAESLAIVRAVIKGETA